MKKPPPTQPVMVRSNWLSSGLNTSTKPSSLALSLTRSFEKLTFASPSFLLLIAIASSQPSRTKSTSKDQGDTIQDDKERKPSQTLRSLENTCFPYVFHRLVVSCKFCSIFFLQSLYNKYEHFFCMISLSNLFA
jgi:hypothetical protein